MTNLGLPPMIPAHAYIQPVRQFIPVIKPNVRIPRGVRTLKTINERNNENNKNTKKGGARRHRRHRTRRSHRK